MLLKNCNLISEEFKGLIDIRVENGKVEEVSKNIVPKEKEEVIDVGGKLVTPGGIDLHVHFSLEVVQTKSCDDFFSGSKASIAGGTTTIVDFVHPLRGESLIDAIKERIKEAEGNSFCDYTFHIGIVEVNSRVEEELTKLEGFNSLKLYTGYLNTVGVNFEQLERMLRLASKLNYRVHLHAELGENVESRLLQLVSEGKNSPKYHPLLRPREEEGKAIKVAVEMALNYNTELYIVHISCKEALDSFLYGRGESKHIYGESCPHYLYLDESLYSLEAEEEALKYVLSPPLRQKEDRERLWSAILSNQIDTIATDHCPFTMEQKINGLKKNNLGLIPGGAPGIQERFPLLLSDALRGNLPIEQVVKLCCSNPARIIRLYPEKGTLIPGSDGDIVIWRELKEELPISQWELFSKACYTIYPEFKLKVIPEAVFVRGSLVYKEGIFYNSGIGKLLKLKRSL